MKKALLALPLAFIVASVASVSTVYAAPITIPGGLPDIFGDSGIATLTVTGNTRILTLSGTTKKLNTDGTPVNLTTQGTYTAVVDLLLNGATTGANESFTITGGSLTVTGNGVTEFSAGAPSLFGFTNTTGSNVAADFELAYGNGSGAQFTAGAIFVAYHASTAIPSYGTNFLDVPFSTNAIVPIGTVDVFAPEPTSLALLGLAAPVILRRRRKA